MREIKFRFFRERPSPKMIYPEHDFYVNFLGVPCGMVENSRGKEELKVLDVIPLQFTGLLDKNGKEIYEGDIVKEYWKPCKDDAAVCGEYIGEIFYEDAGYWTRSKNHHHSITECCDSYEVIGNVYQNPELNLTES